jgi:citrate synthase
MSTTTTTTDESKLHDAARNRLATLSAHLLPSSTTSAALLHPIHLSASSGISPPSNVKGTLTVVDERTGKKYTIEVSADGTVKANDFKKVMDFSALFSILRSGL